MNVYRLDPIEPGHESWRYSKEKDPVWVCAATPEEARELASEKSGFEAVAPKGVPSPWKDESLVACAQETAMTYPDPGQVIREDGSLVDFEA
jgi:hypothetical protein